MAEKILFTAGKGGTGVTTCCVGIAAALAEAGNKTLVVDGDARSASALTVSGCANLQVYTLADYETGGCRAKQTLIRHPSQSNFFLLPTLGCKDEKTIARAAAEIEGLFDTVIFDNCAELCCDRAIVVTEPYAPSVKSADGRIAELLGENKKVSLIVNKVNGGLIYEGEIMLPSELAQILHAPLTAVLPEDLALPLGKWRKSTLKAFKIAAQNVSGKREKTYSALKGYGGARGYIKRKIRSGL